MSDGSPGRGRIWRNVVAVGFLGLTAATAAALWVHRNRLLGRRRRPKVAREPGAPPTLAEEIREALAREAAEAGAELPSAELQEEFARATAWVADEGAGRLSTDGKLALYGCYKQVSAGDAPPDRPRGIEASMKWDAWRRLLGSSRAAAMQQYVSALDGLAPGWREATSPTTAPKHKPDGSSSLGLAVSTMGRIGDPDRNDDVDETPVGQLCQKIADGDVEEACTLLRRQPDLALQADKDGMLPLHWAADRGELQIAKALVDIAQRQLGGAEKYINAPDASGETPLHYAVNTDNVELGRLLVAAGADPKAENADGETPEGLAEGQTAWVAIFQLR